MASVKVKLENPFPHPSPDVTVIEIEVMEPTGKLYALLGEPRVFVFKGEGGGYWIENSEVTRGYMEACIKFDLGADTFLRLSLVDAKQVKEAVLNFFEAADQKLLQLRSTASSSVSTP
jgi:hypothetical protein